MTLGRELPLSGPLLHRDPHAASDIALGVTPGLGNNSSLVAFGACKDSRHMHRWGPLSPPPPEWRLRTETPVCASSPGRWSFLPLFRWGRPTDCVSSQAPAPRPARWRKPRARPLPGRKLAFGRDCVTVWGRARGWGRLGSQHTLTVPVLWDCSFPARPLAPFLS